MTSASMIGVPYVVRALRNPPTYLAVVDGELVAGSRPSEVMIQRAIAGDPKTVLVRLRDLGTGQDAYLGGNEQGRAYATGNMQLWEFMSLGSESVERLPQITRDSLIPRGTATVFNIRNDHVNRLLSIDAAGKPCFVPNGSIADRTNPANCWIIYTPEQDAKAVFGSFNDSTTNVTTDGNGSTKITDSGTSSKTTKSDDTMTLLLIAGAVVLAIWFMKRRSSSQMQPVAYPAAAYPQGAYSQGGYPQQPM